MTKIQDLLFQVNASITFPDGMRDFTLDDEKMRNRSKKWESLGYPRMKGAKSYGPVINIACQSPTGLFVSCGVSTFGENATESSQILLQRATSTTNPQMIDMNGSWMNTD